MTLASFVVSFVTLGSLLFGLTTPRLPNQRGRGAWRAIPMWLLLAGFAIGALILALHSGYQPGPRPLAAGIAIALIVVTLALAVRAVVVTILAWRKPPHE